MTDCIRSKQLVAITAVPKPIMHAAATSTHRFPGTTLEDKPVSFNQPMSVFLVFSCYIKAWFANLWPKSKSAL